MYRKRQLMIVCVCVASLTIYFLLLLVPPTVRTVVALVGVPLVLLSVAYLAGHSMVRESRMRFVYRILPILLACVCGYRLLPDFRRMILRRNLQTVGARVTLQFDESYTYVPNWLKNELDWAFLGQLKQVDFAHRHVPVHQIAKMSFTEPIWFLNLEASEITHDELSQVASLFDAQVVNLSRTSADMQSLDSFAQMRTLKRIYAIKTNVTAEDAKRFKSRYPQIELIVDPQPVGSAASGTTSKPSP